MRVIAGSLGGRLFDSPHSHRTHPMSDKMRGALFNTLGDISSLTVLDAFAGTGALSFEAISRGATSAIAIDHDPAAQRIIGQNIRQLGLAGQVKLVSGTTTAWLRTSGNARFDLVLCDPPYDDLQSVVLERLAAIVKPSGLYVLSWPGNEIVPELPSLILLQQRQYGDAQLAFYRKTA